MKKTFAIIAALFAVTAQTWAQEEEGLSASASTSIVNKYIWRGFNLTDGISIQPGFKLGLAGAYVGYWGATNWDSDDTATEHDLYVGYDWSSDPLGFSVGFTHYEFPSADGTSDEFWFGAKLNSFLSPSVTLYFDIGDEEDGGGDGQYLLFSIAHTIGLADGLDLNLGAGLGYNNELFIDEKGLADLAPSAELVTQVTDHLSISLKAVYSTIINSDVEEAMGADNEFAALLTFNIA